MGLRGFKSDWGEEEGGWEAKALGGGRGIHRDRAYARGAWMSLPDKAGWGQEKRVGRMNLGYGHDFIRR